MSSETDVIAQSILRSKADLVKRWVEAVRSDQRIKSDEDLSEHGIIDHIPTVLDEICWLLRRGEAPTAKNSREARVHAYTRFRQGYRIRDLVCETSLLRLILLDYLSKQIFDDSLIVSLKAFVEASRAINLYLDEELRYAVSIYTEEEKTGETSAP
jgi:hypothetical protein